MSEAPHHDSIDPIALDRNGGHYVYWVNRLTADDLRSKADIATVLAWYRAQLAEAQQQRDEFHKMVGGHYHEAATAYAEKSKAEIQLAECQRERDEAQESLSNERATLRECRWERDAIRELMNCYNLGGWTDALKPMQRALKAEAELAEAQRERDETSKGWQRTYDHDVRLLKERAEKAEAELAAANGEPHADRCAQSRMLKELLVVEKARAERLETAIKKAPHAESCSTNGLHVGDDCDCWKREALEGK